jgi:hypothetical protein
MAPDTRSEDLDLDISDMSMHWIKNLDPDIAGMCMYWIKTDVSILMNNVVNCGALLV